jgi:hypothetical protein
MENTFELSGVVIEIGEVKVLSPYFSKREFKLRYTDMDFKNKIKENKVLFNIQNEDISNLPSMMIDDNVRVKFYVDGRDIMKKDQSGMLNFTTLVCFDLEILSSPSRNTDEDRNAVITNSGKIYKDPLVSATDEELAGLVIGPELEAIFDKKRDKYGLTDEPNVAVESMKSKILSKEEDPFSDIQEVGPNVEQIDKLPF